MKYRLLRAKFRYLGGFHKLHGDSEHLNVPEKFREIFEDFNFVRFLRFKLPDKRERFRDVFVA